MPAYPTFVSSSAHSFPALRGATLIAVPLGRSPSNAGVNNLHYMTVVFQPKLLFVIEIDLYPDNFAQPPGGGLSCPW